MFPLKVLAWGVAACATAWFLTRYVIHRGGNGAPVDAPNGRSSHRRPTVKCGGIGFAATLCAFLMAMGLYGHSWPHEMMNLFGAATIIMAVVGLWADYGDPPAGWRLIVELAAAGLIMGAGVQYYQFRVPWGPVVNLWWAGAPLTLLWVIGATNLFNFIDGADGLAAGLAVVYAAAVATVAFPLHHWAEGIIAVTILSGCLGFLWFNFPPAKVFMGDVGSLTLGFVLSVLALRLCGTHVQPVPMMFFLILYSSFLFDTAYTILRRALRGEKFWLAHRTHLYERLLLSGWSHRQATLFYVGLAMVSAALAFGYLRAGPVGRTAIAAFQVCICLGQVVFVKAVEGSRYVILKPRKREEVKVEV